MATPEEEIVTGYIKLWPREVFYIKPSDCLDEVKKTLNKSGVYILYQDFEVFYIGQAVSLFNRLSKHAAKRYQLWNHFSAFLVPGTHLDYVEAIFIAATPRTANRQAGKKIVRVQIPRVVNELLRRRREIDPKHVRDYM